LKFFFGVEGSGSACENVGDDPDYDVGVEE